MRYCHKAGEMLLDIEARIGELLPSAEEAMKTPVTRPARIRQGWSGSRRDDPEYPCSNLFS